MAVRTPKMNYWQDAPMPRSQLVLFSTSLESRIPEDHPVRLVDELLDEMDWTEWESKYDGAKGKPPIHPSVLCKILLFALVRKIRSSRDVEYALNHSIDFMWLASGRSVDHTTISEFRRSNQKALKDIYTQMIKLGVRMGMVKLKDLILDGSKVLANASRGKTYKREEVEQLIKELAEQMDQALAAMENADKNETDAPAASKLPEDLDTLQKRKAKLEDVKAKLVEMEEQRRRDGIDNKKNPAQLPVNDPDSRILPNKTGGYAPNYTPMCMMETQSGVIVAEDVIIGNVEHLHAIPMVEEVEQTYQSKTETLMADGAFSTGPNLTQAEERDLVLISPVRQEVSKADNPAYRTDLTEPVAEAELDRLPINPTTKRFDRSAFIYDPEHDTYRCPAGKELKREGTVERRVVNGVEVERNNYRCHECDGCPLAARCRTKVEAKTGRKVSHDQFRQSRERQLERMQDPEMKKRYASRQHFGETQFAHIKDILGIRRFLLTGLAGVQQEWRWACMAYNLKKFIKQIGKLRALTESELATDIN